MNNENKGQKLTIDLGVNLFATQEMYEEDSFGEDYDAAAGKEVYTLEELLAAINGGESEIALADNIETDETIVIPEGANVILYLNGNTLKGTMHKNDGAVIKNNGTLTLIGGTVSSTAANGGSAIQNSGTVTINNTTLNGAPNANGSWPSYTVNNTGVMTVNGAKITSYHGAVASYGDGAVVTLNNSEIDMAGIPGFTSHGIYTYNNGKVIVNGGTYANKAADQNATGASVINGAVEITAGTFSGRIENYYGTPVIKGGTFSVKPKAAFIASGSKVVESGEKYVVVADTMPEKNIVANTSELNSAIDTAVDGDTIIITDDITYTGNGYANITKNITLDLNGNTLNTTSFGVVAKAGTIKNGTIVNPVGGRAALRTWSGVSIENVTVVSPKNGGITVASGNSLPYIKNVTIEAATYGIELQNYASVGVIENVTINAGKNGIVAQAATVGEIKNCSINGAECGVWAQLKGTEDLNLTFTNCELTGGNYGLYMCDEGADIVPDGVAYLTYDDNAIISGEVKDIELAFAQENKLVVRVYATTDDGVVMLNNVTTGEKTLYDAAAFTGSVMNVPEGVTAIGNYAFSGSNTVKEVILPTTMTDLGRGFDSSTVEKVVLNEGLETISSRAFRATSNLQSVAISSTVKTIADNAFQKSGIKTITIPANVETIGETAFGASKIETVIIEGNTSIQGYAFRGCPNLREVYLNGDDVTFIASTLNGRNSMWFCNSESNNPNTSNITFYVKNETVAARVKVAMGAEAANTPVYVNGVLYEG